MLDRRSQSKHSFEAYGDGTGFRRFLEPARDTGDASCGSAYTHTNRMRAGRIGNRIAIVGALPFILLNNLRYRALTRAKENDTERETVLSARTRVVRARAIHVRNCRPRTAAGTNSSVEVGRSRTLRM